MIAPYRLLFALLLAVAGGLATAGKAPSLLQGRLFSLEIESAPESLPLNRLHHWELRLLDAKGLPLPGARITVDGGMPAHRHGLPTAPQVSETDEPGRYRLEGLRFSMRGAWELRFRIEAEAGSETLTLMLEL